MKTPFITFKKGQSTILLRMKDDWLVDVKERRKGKVVWDASIIFPDLKKFINRRIREGYSYLRRTIL